MTTKLAGAEFVDGDGTRLEGADFPEDFPWPLGHHPMVMYHQPHLEEMIRSKAIERGVKLNLGFVVESVGQDAASAWIEGNDADGGPVHQRARWVVAADGAASPVRKALGLELQDAGYDRDWLVVDAILNDPSAENGLATHAQQICEFERPITFVPVHGPFRRWELQLNPGEVPEEMVEPERVWKLLERWLTPDQATLSRAVVYRFHATVASAMSEGRIFLAGDAAHQMPPFLGQGLCSGIRDAANLAWKLSAVAEGLAGERLLESYDIERRQHAREMVEFAVEVGRTIDRLAGREECDGEPSTDAAYGGSRPFPYLRHGMLVQSHALAGRQLPQPEFRGASLDEALGGGFALLVGPGADLPAAILDRWTRIGATVIGFGPEELLGPFDVELVPGNGVVFVRPDRYVAAVAGSADEVPGITDELFGWLT